MAGTLLHTSYFQTTSKILTCNKRSEFLEKQITSGKTFKTRLICKLYQAALLFYFYELTANNNYVNNNHIN
jgi:hypothetical protein